MLTLSDHMENATAAAAAAAAAAAKADQIRILL